MYRYNRMTFWVCIILSLLGIIKLLHQTVKDSALLNVNHQDVWTEARLYDVHHHDLLNDVDQFEYRTSKNCSSLDLLKSVDSSLDSIDPELFCDEKAHNSDIACRWFFSQIGMKDIHDPNVCKRTGNQTKVPNIVYYVIFGEYTFEFRHYVSVVGAKRFINPSAIYVIGDAHPTGTWWQRVMRDVQGLRFIYREKPPGINGINVKWNHHLSDIVRLQIIYANGGIYLDTDMLVLRPLEPLFDYGITLGLLDNGTGMGNAIIVAKRGSKFIRKWYESYHEYKREEFYRNSLQVPRDMWHKNPESIHMESDSFYRPNWYEKDKLFKGNDYPWREKYAIHIWTHKLMPKSFEQVKKRNTTIGQIFRYVLYGSSDIR